MRRTTWTLFSILSLVALVLVGIAVVPGQPASAGEQLEFSTVKEQAAQFIHYERSIRLTPTQEAIKKEALEAIPAACCSDNNAYTCCCPCNLSRTVWGLSAYLITEENADAETVRTKAQEWIQFVNPEGFSGNVCYSGGCTRAFADNGCGGMSPSHLEL